MAFIPFFELHARHAGTHARRHPAVLSLKKEGNFPALKQTEI